ncbi:hypothetical protein [Hyphomicrobium sp.]|uniref:hypothetical protein n=1 Tax=Hyphomicrobium sp. TaxID=82 RepID=UPI0025BE70D7|nr:hypothetical protein [Hyphomicrobium sp.]
MQIGDLGSKFVASNFEANEPFSEAAVIGIHDTLLDECQKSDDPRFGILMRLSKSAQPLLDVGGPAVCRFQIDLQEITQAVGMKYAGAHLVDDDPVQPLHRHAQSFACRRPFLQLSRATVVAIEAALSSILN